MVVRHYLMTAKSGREQALIDALNALAEEIRSLEGCLGFEILQDRDDPAQIVFIERWTSIEAHQSTGSKITKNVLGPIRAALAGPEKGSYLNMLARH